MGFTMQRITMVMASLFLAATLPLAGQAQRTAGRGGTAAGAADERMLGWVLGVHTVAAPGVSITGEDIDGTFSTAFGSGVGAMVGYGFSRMLTGFVSLDVARQNVTSEDVEGNFALVHLEVGARLNIPMASPRTVPYASAAIGRRGLGAQATHGEFDEPHPFSLSGTVLTLGGGVQHFFSPQMALDAGLNLGFGSFSQFDDDGDKYRLDVDGSTSVRLKVGLTWRP